MVSAYNFCQSNKCLETLNLSGNTKNAIEYFRVNRLSKYDGPFLTEIALKHTNNIFITDSNGNDNEFVRLAFMNHCYYRNLCYFYHNIDKYCKSNWHKNNFSSQESEIICVKQTFPIYYFDIQLDISSEIICRF